MRLSGLYMQLIEGFPEFYAKWNNYTGICVFIGNLNSKGEMADIYVKELLKDMNENRPADTGKTFGYWWQLGDKGLQPRMNFLNDRRDYHLAVELGSAGWEQTDASTNQYFIQLDCEGYIYKFREDRIINPVTKEFEVYEETINLEDYDLKEMISACDTFGYTAEEVEDWWNKGTERALIAECLFELSEE